MDFKCRAALVLMILVSNVAGQVGSAQQVNPITLSYIELVTVDESSATVTWVTNLPSDTRIEWGETEALGYGNVVDESVNYHMAGIQNLAQGTSYYYRIGSGDQWSDVSAFTTLLAPGGGLTLSFAIAADPHYDVDGSNTANGNMNEDSPRLLASLVSELNTDSEVDFVITTGDITNGAEADYEGLASDMGNLNTPWYPVLGNSDKQDDSWSTWYENHLGRSKTYYSMDLGGYHFVVLDSAVQNQIYGDMDDTQLAWLSDDLEANTDSPTLIFMHHMVQETQDEIYGLSSSAYAGLVDILSYHPQVLSVISGHIHQNILNYIGDQLNLAVASTVQYPIGYSIVKLYGNGYTQAFHKIASELETSEESRLRINTNSGNPDAYEDYIGGLSERSLVVEIPGGEPPVISSLEVDPPTVKPQGTVTITVTAHDPEGDSLTYFYEPESGTISGHGDTVTWKAPDATGSFGIIIWVSDGERSSEKEDITITVSENVQGYGDNGTPGFDGALMALIIAFLFIIIIGKRVS